MRGLSVSEVVIAFAQEEKTYSNLSVFQATFWKLFQKDLSPDE